MSFFPIFFCSYLLVVTHHDNSLVTQVDTEEVSMLLAQLIKGLKRCQPKVPREGEAPEDGKGQEGSRWKAFGDAEPEVEMDHGQDEEDGQENENHGDGYLESPSCRGDAVIQRDPWSKGLFYRGRTHVEQHTSLKAITESWRFLPLPLCKLVGKGGREVALGFIARSTI